MWALHRLGVSHIIATTACGSLREEYAPGDLVVVSDFIDMTKQRLSTHVGTAVKTGGPAGVIHLPSKPAFDEKLRSILVESMIAARVAHKPAGTVITIEGPRFSSFAESKIFSKVFGADIVNMTTCPEGTSFELCFLYVTSYATLSHLYDSLFCTVTCSILTIQSVLPKR